MSKKRLPYFKFDVMSWLTGNISLLDPHEQGIFISLCALVWRDGGKYTIDKLTHRKLNTSQQVLNDCVQVLADADILLNTDGVLSVEFIDEQLSSISEERAKKSKAGKASAEARKKAQQVSTTKSRVEESRVEKNREKKDNTPKPPKGATIHDSVVSGIKWPAECDQEIKEAFLDFLAERRDKRHYVTERALKALFKSLQGFSKEEQMEAINKAISGGHQSLYPKKSHNQVKTDAMIESLNLDGPEWDTP